MHTVDCLHDRASQYHPPERKALPLPYCNAYPKITRKIATPLQNQNNHFIHFREPPIFSFIEYSGYRQLYPSILALLNSVDRNALNPRWPHAPCTCAPPAGEVCDNPHTVDSKAHHNAQRLGTRHPQTAIRLSLRTMLSERCSSHIFFQPQKTCGTYLYAHRHDSRKIVPVFHAEAHGTAA